MDADRPEPYIPLNREPEAAQPSQAEPSRPELGRAEANPAQPTCTTIYEYFSRANLAGGTIATVWGRLDDGTRPPKGN